MLRGTGGKSQNVLRGRLELLYVVYGLWFKPLPSVTSIGIIFEHSFSQIRVKFQ
jgi:hypothetical protein